VFTISCAEQDAAFYFALEEYCITNFPADADTLFLLWQTRPTVMLGKYQNALKEIDPAYIAAEKIDVVRRPSGGGAIYTDEGCYQYSFIVNGQHNVIDFEPYMDRIIHTLQTLGIPAERNSRNDIAIHGQKISGNAQYMKAGFTVHHGTLLFDTNVNHMAAALKVDPEKLRSKGVESVRERTALISDHVAPTTKRHWFADEFRQNILGQGAHIIELTPEQHEAVQQLADQKYRRWEWNYGQSRETNFSVAGRLPGGRIEIALQLDHYVIQYCQISGDFFSSIDIATLESALCDTRFDKSDVANHLAPVLSGGQLYGITTTDIVALLFPEA
jgi:lipoate---protein ligase